MNEDKISRDYQPNKYSCRLCHTNCCSSPGTIHLHKQKAATLALVEKINKYLPVKVTKQDESLICCRECANIILKFDQIYLICQSTICMSDEEENVQMEDDQYQDKEEILNKKERPEFKILDQKNVLKQEKGSCNQQNGESDINQNSEEICIKKNRDDDDCNFEEIKEEIEDRDYYAAIKRLNQTKEEVSDLILDDPRNTLEQNETHVEYQRSQKDDGEGYQKTLEPLETLKEEQGTLKNEYQTFQEPVKPTVISQGDNQQDKITPSGLTRKEIIEARVWNGKKTVYKCKVCDQILQHLSSLKIHFRIHTGERPYVCDVCGEKFRLPKELSSHVDEAHNKVSEYACDFCQQAFGNVNDLKKHRLIHTNERSYVCELCGQYFTQSFSLLSHMKLSHQKSLPFQCSACVRVFRTKTLLKLHMRKHTEEMSNCCNQCGKMYKNNRALMKHFTNKHK